MKRRVLMLALLLLLGAIVNVAVASGCSYPKNWPDSNFYDLLRSVPEMEWVERLGMPIHPPNHVLVCRSNSLGAEYRRYLWTPEFADSASACLGFQLQAGLPLRSLSGDLMPAAEDPRDWFASPSRAYQSRFVIHPDSPPWTRNDWNIGQIVPLHPIWPGFAINTVFYAAALWMIFALGGTPFALRKRRRIKRGLCPKCAYPVGTWGGEKCTECGATVCR